MANRWGNSGNNEDFMLLDSKIIADTDSSHKIKWYFLLGRKTMTNLDSILKSRDITLPTKVRIVKAVVFAVVKYRCESWTIKKAEYQSIWTVILEKTLESPLDCKDIKPISPKRNQSWIFIGRTDVEAETPILWPPDVKNWPTGKDTALMLGKIEGKRRWGWQDGMVEWHH